MEADNASTQQGTLNGMLSLSAAAAQALEPYRLS